MAKKTHMQGPSGRDFCGKAAWPSGFSPGPEPKVTRVPKEVTCKFCVQRMLENNWPPKEAHESHPT